MVIPRILLIDNYDSFTYNLYDYLLQLGVECEVVRNDAISLQAIERWAPDGLVFSPGPERPEQAGILLACIHAFKGQIPMLGICLGHQAMGLDAGAQLVHAPRPVHGQTSPIFTIPHPLFEGLPHSFEVMRYHSLVLRDIPPDTFDIIANTEDGIIMAIAHRHFSMIGIQFHPESILTPHGLGILSNWLSHFVAGKLV